MTTFTRLTGAAAVAAEKVQQQFLRDVKEIQGPKGKVVLLEKAEYKAAVERYTKAFGDNNMTQADPQQFPRYDKLLTPEVTVLRPHPTDPNWWLVDVTLADIYKQGGKQVVLPASTPERAGPLPHLPRNQGDSRCHCSV